MNIPDSDENKTIKKLEDKILELESRLKTMPELIESNMLDSQINFIFDVSNVVEGTWEKWKSNDDISTSSEILISGFSELKEMLGKYSQENLQWPKVETEKQELMSLPLGVKIEDTAGKLKIEIETKNSNDLLVQHRFEGKNIDPVGVFIIRELCILAIIQNIPSHTVGRRERIEEVFKSREFKERLKKMLGDYPKVGANEQKRLLDIVSNHVGDKFPEI